jgi:hypothetical protein
MYPSTHLQADYGVESQKHDCTASVDELFDALPSLMRHHSSAIATKSCKALIALTNGNAENCLAACNSPMLDGLTYLLGDEHKADLRILAATAVANISTFHPDASTAVAQNLSMLGAVENMAQDPCVPLRAKAVTIFSCLSFYDAGRTALEQRNVLDLVALPMLESVRASSVDRDVYVALRIDLLTIIANLSRVSPQVACTVLQADDLRLLLSMLDAAARRQTFAGVLFDPYHALLPLTALSAERAVAAKLDFAVPHLARVLQACSDAPGAPAGTLLHAALALQCLDNALAVAQPAGPRARALAPELAAAARRLGHVPSLAPFAEKLAPRLGALRCERTAAAPPSAAPPLRLGVARCARVLHALRRRLARPLRDAGRERLLSPADAARAQHA